MSVSNPGISPADIVVIWPVIAVSNRAVVPAVRLGVDHTEIGSRPYKVPVERLVYIIPVIWVDKAHMVIVIAK